MLTLRMPAAYPCCVECEQRLRLYDAPRSATVLAFDDGTLCMSRTEEGSRGQPIQRHLILCKHKPAVMQSHGGSCTAGMAEGTGARAFASPSGFLLGRLNGGGDGILLATITAGGGVGEQLASNRRPA